MLLFSPANTYGCLTEQCSGGEPQKYYPSGKRTYARVAPSDPNQAGLQASLMQKAGVKTLYILNDKEAYGLGIAKNVRGAAAAAGIKVVGFSAYDPKAPNFQATFTKIQNTNPDAIFIGGLVDENSGQLINDKVSDTRTEHEQAEERGRRRDAVPPGRLHDDGDLRQVAGRNDERQRRLLHGRRRRHRPVRRQGARRSSTASRRPTASRTSSRTRSCAAQAAQVLLDAIEKSDGSRAEVITNVFDTHVTDGLIGSFSFNKNGDLSGATGPSLEFTVYDGKNNTLNTIKTTTPPTNLVQAARRAGATAS